MGDFRFGSGFDLALFVEYFQGVRHFAIFVCPSLFYVSIHAPLRSATSLKDNKSPSLRFQSTHPYGVRPKKDSPTKIYRVFQSTHPYGVRPHGRYAWEFTNMFQSTHPYGVRQLTTLKLLPQLQFQSTHPYGVRRCVKRDAPVSYKVHPYGVRLLVL